MEILQIGHSDFFTRISNRQSNMYIIIADELIDEGTDNPYFCECVKMLLLAHKEGRHIISISPKKTKQLIASATFTGETQAILTSYYYKFCRQAKSLIKYFSKVFTISSSHSAVRCYTDVTTKTEHYIVHTDTIQHSADIQNTIILGENTCDCHIFKIIGNYYLQSINIADSVAIKGTNQLGGGDTTAQAFTEIHLEKHSFCLCILDSDQKMPCDTLGQTAHKVEKFAQRNQLSNFKSQHHVIKGFRELENLLPDEFYAKKYSFDVNKKDILKTLSGYDLSARCFFDMKHGIKCEFLNQNSAASKYWQTIMSFNQRVDCLKIWNNTYKCNYRLIPGYGTNILNDFIDYCKTADIYEMIDKSTETLKASWLFLGKVIASFCCGTSRMVTI
jgi:hypothetical protein